MHNGSPMHNGAHGSPIQHGAQFGSPAPNGYPGHCADNDYGHHIYGTAGHDHYAGPNDHYAGQNDHYAGPNDHYTGSNDHYESHQHQQPVVLREPEPNYVDPSRMRANKTVNRPPPPAPPRRSQNTQLTAGY